MDPGKARKKVEVEGKVRFFGTTFSSDLDLAIKYFSSTLVNSFF